MEQEAWLRREGHHVNRKRVQRLMHLMGIEAVIHDYGSARIKITIFNIFYIGMEATLLLQIKRAYNYAPYYYLISNLRHQSNIGVSLHISKFPLLLL